MLKILKKTLYILLILLAILLALVYFLLGTNTGYRQLPKLIGFFSPYHIEYSTLDGKLLGTQRIENLKIHNNNQTILQAAHLELALNPKALWQKTIDIEHLHLKNATLHLPASTPSKEEEKEITPFERFTLQDQQLPIAFKLQELHIEQFNIYQNTHPLLNILELKTQANAQQSNIALNTSGQIALSDAKLFAQFNLESALELKNNYPIKLHLTSQIQQEQNNEQIKLNITGSLRNPEINLQTQGIINSEIKAHAQLNEENLTAQAQWQITESTEIPLKSTGTLSAQGLWQDFIFQLESEILENELQAKGQLQKFNNINSEINISAKNLNALIKELKGDIEGNIKIKGEITDPEILSNITWQNLSLQEFALPQGNLQSKGTLNLLSAEVQSTWRVAKNNNQLQVQATLEALNQLKNLTLNNTGDNGTIQLQAQAQWQNNPSWQLSAFIEKFNLHTFIPQLDSTLSAEIKSQGQITNNDIELQANIDTLKGTWFGAPLQGALQLKAQNNKWQLPELQLQIGDNHINAQANITLKEDLLKSTLQANLNLDIKQLAEIYPELQGKAQGQITLNNTLEHPIILGEITTQNLQINALKLESLQLNLNSQLQEDGDFNNHLQLKNLQIAEQHWQNLELITQGQYQTHQIKINAPHQDYPLNLTAHGGFIAQNSWQGIIENLSFALKQAPWQLTEKTPITLSPEKIALGNLCLKDNYSAFCLNFTQQQTISFGYLAQRLDPQSFSAFMPKGMRSQSYAYGSGQIIIKDDNIYGQALLNLSPGRIIVQIPNQPPLELDIESFNLNQQFKAQDIQSSLDIKLKNIGIIQAAAELKAKNSLKSTLNIEIPNIGEFNYLIPQITDLAGKISGAFEISGPLNALRAKGDINLTDGALNVPAYATELKNINLHIRDNEKGNIAINGSIGTPEGQLETNGELTLDPIAFTLNLEGENLRIANSNELTIDITPKFNINIQPEQGINIQGDIFIPNARIDIPDLSSAISPSKDVVFIGEQKEEAKESAPPMPLNAIIRVRLGDRVFFSNSDLALRLVGALSLMIQNSDLSAMGRIEVASGSYELYGQELNIERGWATFSGDIANPNLDIIALREVDNVSVGASLSGTINNLQFKLSSNPSMPDSAILSYLLFGRAPDGSTDSAALMETALILGAQGIGKAILPKDLAKRTGLDVFDLNITGLKAGKYLSQNIYIGMQSDFFNAITELLARYQINKRLSLEASASTEDGNAIDFIYEFEKD